MGQEPVSIVHYTRIGSSIKHQAPQPKLRSYTISCKMACIYLKVSTKSWIQYKVALPLLNRSFTESSHNLRKIFIATLLWLPPSMADASLGPTEHSGFKLKARCLRLDRRLGSYHSDSSSDVLTEPEVGRRQLSWF